jgi:hypothetical protein
MSGFPMALVVPGALTAAPDHPPAVSATPLSDTARGYAREASAPSHASMAGGGMGEERVPA